MELGLGHPQLPRELGQQGWGAPGVGVWTGLWPGGHTRRAELASSILGHQSQCDTRMARGSEGGRRLVSPSQELDPWGDRPLPPGQAGRWHRQLERVPGRTRGAGVASSQVSPRRPRCSWWRSGAVVPLILLVFLQLLRDWAFSCASVTFVFLVLFSSLAFFFLSWSSLLS